MSTRSFARFLLVSSVVLCAAAALAQAPASIFQLDGNAATDGAVCNYGTCDSWDLLNGTGGSGVITHNGVGHSAVNVYINGGSSSDAFAGGGSKDSNPISQWSYSSGNTPGKDTLDAGYAAGYNVSDFDVVFGADRLSPNGDANIGIWFFQQTVAPVPGTSKFSGAHTNGDVFVISAFTGGGGTSTISVYAWNQAGLPGAIGAGCPSGVKNPVPGQCADTNLLLLADPTSVCGSSYYCAVTNSATTNATWASYSTPPNQLASPLFFEGGVDITQAFANVGGAVPCFSSFLEETRSSQSTTSVLKDFLAGGFPVCSMSVSKTCGVAYVNPNGTTITYPVGGTVTNTGIGTIYGVQVIDKITGGATNTINVSPSTLTAGQVGTWSDSSTSTSTSESDQASAQGSSNSNGTPINIISSNTASATCSLAVSTTLTVSKSCSTILQQAPNGSTVQVQVMYGGTITNTGSSQVTGISLEDYPDSIANGTGGTGSTVQSSITLAPGASMNYGPFTYIPTAIDETISGGTGNGRYFFDDLITIPTATATLGTLTKVSSMDPRTNGTYGYAPARCPICQGSGECTP
jgi:hypothetical protein